MRKREGENSRRYRLPSEFSEKCQRIRCPLQFPERSLERACGVRVEGSGSFVRQQLYLRQRYRHHALRFVRHARAPSAMLQAKRSENMSFRSERSASGLPVTLNYMPAFSYQHTYAPRRPSIPTPPRWLPVNGLSRSVRVYLQAAHAARRQVWHQTHPQRQLHLRPRAH